MESFADLDLRRDTRLFFNRHTALFWLFLATVVADFASTISFMALYGPAMEANLIVRFLAEELGILWGPFAGKFLQILAVWGFSMLALRMAPFVLSALIGLNLIAVLMNMTVVAQAVA